MSRSSERFLLRINTTVAQARPTTSMPTAVNVPAIAPVFERKPLLSAVSVLDASALVAEEATDEVLETLRVLLATTTAVAVVPGTVVTCKVVLEDEVLNLKRVFMSIHTHAIITYQYNAYDVEVLDELDVLVGVVDVELEDEVLDEVDSEELEVSVDEELVEVVEDEVDVVVGGSEDVVDDVDVVDEVEEVDVSEEEVEVTLWEEPPLPLPFPPSSSSSWPGPSPNCRATTDRLTPNCRA